jgi:histidine ammonia-lyase
LKNVRIPPADTRQLQRNLMMSHAGSTSSARGPQVSAPRWRSAWSTC